VAKTAEDSTTKNSRDTAGDAAYFLMVELPRQYRRLARRLKEKDTRFTAIIISKSAVPNKKGTNGGQSSNRSRQFKGRYCAALFVRHGNPPGVLRSQQKPGGPAAKTPSTVLQ
jgi:hypothetical protein